METTTARYLEFLIRDFYDRLKALLVEFGLSNEEMETVYALGYKLFVLGNYVGAKEVFVLLTGEAPYTAHYWRALGAVNQQTKDYSQAIAAYDMAIANDDADVVSYVYRGESQILMGALQPALEDFQKVLEITSGGDPQFAAWSDRSRLLLSIHNNPDSTVG